MDTPDKKSQPSPSLLSKFEDSPVFNYISSLSPIKPFKFSHSGQSFHLLNFASPQSAQTSPPTNSEKEATITSTIHASDALKNNCSDNGSEGRSGCASNAAQPAGLHVEQVDSFDSGEITVNGTDESSQLVELPKSLKYDCGSPDSGVLHCDAAKPNCEFNMAGIDVSPPKGTEDITGEANCSFANEMGVPGIQLEQNKEVCDWDTLIDEASDILNCNTPAKEKHHEELDDKNLDSGVLSFVATVLQPPNDQNIDDPQKFDSVCPPFMSSENHDMEVPLSRAGDGIRNEPSQVATDEARAVLAEEVVHYSRTQIDDKSCSQQQQMRRRRCLVYEMSGSHYRKMLCDSPDSSPISKPSASPPNSSSNGKSSVSSRSGTTNKYSNLLPGIGLHLNALAATARDKIIVKRQTLTCRRQLISTPSTMSSFESLTSDAKPLHTLMAPPDILGRDTKEENGVPVTGNACQNSSSGEGIEVPQNSPKKKRRKSENVGEGESCKRCNCKRSKCLKLYCECFAAGLYCVEPCNCQDCFNKPSHEETVLETRRQIESRNPLAFAPKVIRSSCIPHDRDELNKTPASARHKRGCNCKKSGCLKKYCECFQGGVGCSLSCRCEGCKNTFGRKEGTEGIAFEGTQILERSKTDASLHNEFPETDEQIQDEETPVPLKSVRPPVRRPFHFGGGAPQFPSLQQCGTQTIVKSEQGDFEEDSKLLTQQDEVEAPEMLKGDYSSLPTTTCVKSTSPNCKRVSPPHCDFETSPGWRSCRKLILRSIPSIPKVTPKKPSIESQGKL